MPVESLWPLALYAALILGTFGSMLLASWLVGERHSEVATAEPYESGVAPTGGLRPRQVPRFYVMGALFVVFDAEAAFLITWAVAVRETGWAGFLEVLFFSGVLLASLLWLWRVGALDWGSTTRRIRHAPPTRLVRRV